MASVGGDSNAGDNDGPGTSGMGDGGEPGNDSGLGDRGGDRGGNSNRGGRDNYTIPIYSRPKPPTYNAENPHINTLQMGGAQPTYQTQAPNYTDLKAKHTAGYQDPVSKTRNMPQSFNFNGTVYQYEPDNDAYRDMYTGQLIGPGSSTVGSQGIAGLYANEQVNGQQYVPQQAPVQAAPQPVLPQVSKISSGLLDKVKKLLINRAGTQGQSGMGIMSLNSDIGENHR